MAGANGDVEGVVLWLWSQARPHGVSYSLNKNAKPIAVCGVEGASCARLPDTCQTGILLIPSSDSQPLICVYNVDAEYIQSNPTLKSPFTFALALHHKDAVEHNALEQEISKSAGVQEALKEYLP